MHHCITFQYSALALTNIRRSSSVQQSRSYTLHAANDAASQQTHAYDAAIDWSLQNLRHEYQKSGGILYKQSVLMPEEFSSLTSSLSELNLKMEDESESSFATNRVGCRIDDVGVCDLIAGGSLGRLMNVLCLDEDEVGWVLAPDIPIELRIYEKNGAGMEWHIDDILYDPPQVEVVLTLENSSDCCTLWKKLAQYAQQQVQSTKSQIESVQTTPNSAIILKSGGVSHKVSALCHGKRSILKFAFVKEGAVLLDDMRKHVSHHRGVGKNKTAKKKR